MYHHEKMNMTVQFTNPHTTAILKKRFNHYSRKCYKLILQTQLIMSFAFVQLTAILYPGFHN